MRCTTSLPDLRAKGLFPTSYWYYPPLTPVYLFSLPPLLHLDALARRERHVVPQVLPALDRVGVEPRRVPHTAAVVPQLLPARSPPALRRALEESARAVGDGEVHAAVRALDAGRRRQQGAPGEGGRGGADAGAGGLGRAARLVGERIGLVGGLAGGPRAVALGLGHDGGLCVGVGVLGRVGSC